MHNLAVVITFASTTTFTWNERVLCHRGSMTVWYRPCFLKWFLFCPHKSTDYCGVTFFVFWSSAACKDPEFLEDPQPQQGPILPLIEDGGEFAVVPIEQEPLHNTGIVA